MPTRKIESSSLIRTHKRLSQVAHFFRDEAETASRGKAHYLLGSLVFCAFTLEAYLNHLGSHVVEGWEEQERGLSVRRKLQVIFEYLSIAPDLTQRPWSSVDKLVALRHQLAHGRTQHLAATYYDHADRDAPFPVALPEWEEVCESNEVDRFLEDVRQITQYLNEVADLEEPLPGLIGWIGGAVSTTED